MGTPNAPAALRLTLTTADAEVAGELQLTWQTPDWGGGYPLSHYSLLVERYTGGEGCAPPPPCRRLSLTRRGLVAFGWCEDVSRVYRGSIQLTRPRGHLAE